MSSDDDNDAAAENVSGSEAIGAALVAATIKLLGGVPPHKVTSRQIAAEAGVNVGQIHHFFGSKDNLIIAAMNSTMAHNTSNAGEGRPSLPIQTEERSANWSTMAYIAACELWQAAPPEEPNEIIDLIVAERAAERALAPTHPHVTADVAALVALQSAWWTFRDLIECALEPYGVDVPRLRADVAQRSERLFDESLPLLPGVERSTDSPACGAAECGVEADGAEEDGAVVCPLADRASRPRPQGREEVRESLLDAAVELISARAMSEVTTKDIAALAGVNHGQVHHYFGSKGDLVAEASERDSRSFIEQRMDGGGSFPLPIDPGLRTPLWRALAHNAMTGGWDRPNYGQVLVVQRMVEARAADLGCDPKDPDVLADAAVVHAYGIGWDVFQDVINFVLRSYGGVTPEVEDRISAISNRLVGPTIDLTASDAGERPRGETLRR